MMMNPEEIKKGLECCVSAECPKQGCPYYKCQEDIWCGEAKSRDALAYIQQLEAQVPRWISVEESLPERYEHVLVITRFTDDGEPDVEIAYLALKRWQKPEGTLWGKVTHWMPLPEPPEK